MRHPPRSDRFARCAPSKARQNLSVYLGPFCVPTPEGTLAERYLAGRFLLPVTNDLRFHPRCPFGRKPLTVFKPALLVGVREGKSLVAVQRIAIDPVTCAYTDKATLGQLGTGAWQGGGLAASIALAEGFESARAFSILHDDKPCWTSLGSRRLDLVDMPDEVTDLTLAGDNDTPGRLAVRKAIQRYVSATRIIRVAWPPKGFKDWAEVLEARYANPPKDPGPGD